MLEPRIFSKNVQKLSNVNQYIEKPVQKNKQVDDEDANVFEENVYRSKFHSY